MNQDTWDGFAPSSICYSSWLRESADILLVINCMLRNKSHHFSQSSTTVIIYLELFLPIFAMIWASTKKYKAKYMGRELIFVNNFLQPVLGLIGCPVPEHSYFEVLRPLSKKVFHVSQYLQTSNCRTLWLQGYVGGKWVRPI